MSEYAWGEDPRKWVIKKKRTSWTLHAPATSFWGTTHSGLTFEEACYQYKRQNTPVLNWWEPR